MQESHEIFGGRTELVKAHAHMDAFEYIRLLGDVKPEMDAQGMVVMQMYIAGPIMEHTVGLLQLTDEERDYYLLELRNSVSEILASPK